MNPLEFAREAAKVRFVEAGKSKLNLNEPDFRKLLVQEVARQGNFLKGMQPQPPPSHIVEICMTLAGDAAADLFLHQREKHGETSTDPEGD